MGNINRQYVGNVEKYKLRKAGRRLARLDENETITAPVGTVSKYLMRKYARLDAKRADAEEGKWITTKNGHKIHINEEGIADKGNSFVTSAFNSQNPHIYSAIHSSPKEYADSIQTQKTDADKTLRPVTAKVWRNMNDVERKAIFDYTNGGYGKVNRYLARSAEEQNKMAQKYSGLRERVENIEKAISKSILPKDMFVARSMPKETLAKMLGIEYEKMSRSSIESCVGKEYVHKPFASTTTAMHEAGDKKFSDERNDVVFHIFCPKGTNALYVEPFSGHGGLDRNEALNWNPNSDTPQKFGETEVVLQHGSIFKINSVEFGEYGIKKINAEIVSNTRHDADDKEEGNGGGGNTRLPYGIAKGEGIDTAGMSPKQVWEALEGKGYSASAEYKKLKERKSKEPSKKAGNLEYESAKSRVNAVLDKLGVMSIDDHELENRLKFKRDELAGLHKELGEVTNPETLEPISSLEEATQVLNELTEKQNALFHKIIYGYDQTLADEYSETRNNARLMADKVGKLSQITNVEKELSELEELSKLKSDEERLMPESERKRKESIDEYKKAKKAFADGIAKYHILDWGKANEHLESWKQMVDDMPQYKDMLEKNIRDYEIGIKECSKLEKSMNDALGKLSERDAIRIKDKEKMEFDESLFRSAGVAYKKPQKSKGTASEEQIISSLGGGDKTKGSCMSLALAFVGNKAGYNVLDFRDGNSRELFCKGSFSETLCELNGVKSVEGGDSLLSAASLLEKISDDKQYVFRAASHAAIVKKQDGKTYYLELQSPTANGWKELDNTTLRERFGFWKDADGIRFPSKLIDVDSLAQNETFIDMLGYLNTADNEQKKGGSGSAK